MRWTHSSSHLAQNFKVITKVEFVHWVSPVSKSHIANVLLNLNCKSVHFQPVLLVVMLSEEPAQLHQRTRVLSSTPP